MMDRGPEVEEGQLNSLQHILSRFREEPRGDKGKGRALPEGLYRNLFNSIPDGVYLSALDGHILAVNPALVRLLGFDSEEELIGVVNAATLYQAPQQRAGVIADLVSKGSLRNRELTLKRKDGSLITVLENASVVRDESGEVLFLQGTLTDITAHKQVETALREARDEALEASRHKTQFLANISHELRTPLNAVMGLARLLSDDLQDPQQREYAEMIQHSAHFLTDIINEVLDFSRIEAGRLVLEPAPFRLRELIEDSILPFAERAWAKSLELICDPGDDLPEMAISDASRIRQILTNLTGNALKFTERGSVVVRAGVAGPAGPEGRRVTLRLEVIDTGIGIAAEHLPLIFEPFRQVDGSAARRYGGAGLGLSITREIVSRMGGSIAVESRRGEGSRFTVSLPLEVAPDGWGGEPRPCEWLAGRWVAVAALDPALETTLARWLSKAGARVLAANRAGDGDLPPADVAVMDAACVTRAGMRRTGLEDVPLLILTDLRSEGSPLAPQARRQASVVKPLRRHVFLKELERLLEQREEQAPMELLALSRRAASAPPRAHILVAEDNAVNQTVISKLLEKLGYAVTLASNGHEVLRAAGAGGHDLVLMDCQMPGMDGFEATALIRRLPEPHNRLPIIAVTAHAIAGDRENCLAAGMNDYLSKPILLEDLAETLRRWLPEPAASLAGLTRERM